MPTRMAQSIKDTGKAAIYGIYFDSGKAEIKPESEPSLQEIAKFLKMEPKMKFYVVGHTDNVGTLEFNLKLSKDRADAVVKALVGKFGIPASQLTACPQYGVLSVKERGMSRPRPAYTPWKQILNVHRTAPTRSPIALSTGTTNLLITSKP